MYRPFIFPSKHKWWQYFQISNLQINSGGYQRIPFIHNEWETQCHRRILPWLELLIHVFTKYVHTCTCTIMDRKQEMEDFFTVTVKLTWRCKYCTFSRNYVKLKEKLIIVFLKPLIFEVWPNIVITVSCFLTDSEKTVHVGRAP